MLLGVCTESDVSLVLEEILVYGDMDYILILTCYTCRTYHFCPTDSRWQCCSGFDAGFYDSAYG